MCGVAGLMMRGGRTPDPAVLDRLEAALAHRGPDMSGRHVADGVALVHTRLSIIGLGDGRQPLSGPPGLTVVANGEIYNDPALRAEMPRAGFRTGSDCEPPVHLYARLGLDYAAKLRGMYGIAIHDANRRRLVLSRDPFGIKPLYYVETPECFAFASELQALLRAGLARPGVAPAQRAELMQLKFTTGAETIIPGIRRVLPGETLAIEDGRVVERRQVRALPAAPPLRRSRRDALAELDRVLEDSVAAHLRAEVPYGLFLSGGIDSSALLALMRRLDGKVRAISAGYAGVGPSDESFEAERLARAAGAEFHRVEMREADFWSLAPRIAAALDDPTTDAAVLPSWLLGRAAREAGLKVTLCGEGADELFGGYSRYRRGRAPWRWVQGRTRTRGVFAGFPDMEAALPDWREGLERAEAQEPVPGWTRLQELQAMDCAEWLPNDLLGKLDRCLMAHGIEGRTPFIDPVVAEFAHRLPDAAKIGPRLGKVLLRAWLAEHFPAARPYARKKGFKPPVGQWIAARREELARLVAGQPGVAEMAGPEAVAAVFADPARHPQPAWSLLFYALWHQHHIVGVPCEGSVAEILHAT